MSSSLMLFVPVVIGDDDVNRAAAAAAATPAQAKLSLENIYAGFAETTISNPILVWHRSIRTTRDAYVAHNKGKSHTRRRHMRHTQTHTHLTVARFQRTPPVRSRFASLSS